MESDHERYYLAQIAAGNPITVSQWDGMAYDRLRGGQHQNFPRPGARVVGGIPGQDESPAALD